MQPDEVVLLSVISLQYESCPVVRIGPAFVLHHLELRTAQGGAWAFALLYTCIEARHQCCGRIVIHLPQACNDTFGSRIQEATRQTYDPFGLQVPAQRRVTGTENHEIGRKLQLVNVAQAQIAILPSAPPIYR